MKLDLNCDMGESFGAWTMGRDSEMFEIITSANIACGFHAGDPDVMANTLAGAANNQVHVGAHPSFFDLYGFGRRPILGESPRQIENQVIYQIGALQALAHSQGLVLSHVKTHGALGNMAAEDPELACAVAQAIYKVDKDLMMVVMPGMETERAALKRGLAVAREIYLDRAYADNGNLLSRKLPGAVLHDAEQASRRLVQMLDAAAIITVSGKKIPVSIDTVCVHGDTPGAVEMARQVRQSLEKQGVTFAPMREVVAQR
ncbi:LamB/YcsF family protein [Erwinia endophytica]|uniref:LamB/YcsF family protein n=1 Tax=Erwinia endophytica TaxID=1563158 RepID=UPI0012660645|nr:5-oxoprolinase subunit PxpA [Erwinia endophytica]KAB8306219.1 LamB/YcsF family protein [Erwinia endophytica]